MFGMRWHSSLAGAIPDLDRRVIEAALESAAFAVRLAPVRLRYGQPPGRVLHLLGDLGLDAGLNKGVENEGPAVLFRVAEERQR